MNPFAIVAHGADNVPLPVVSFPIAEEIHRWVVSVADDDAETHEVCPVELPCRTWPVVAWIAGRISVWADVPEVVVIKVELVPFDTAKDTLVNVPALDVAPAVAVRFWVFVWSEERSADVR